VKIKYVIIACIFALFLITSLPSLSSDFAIVQAEEPSVTTNDASNITTTGATLNGKLTDKGASDNITVRFQWGLAISYGSETTTQVMTTTGTFDTSISGLSPDTTYHFRAIADGTSYGEDETFTTTKTAPTVLTNDATGITDTGAILNGNLIDKGASDNITVRFQWGTTSSYGHLTTTQVMTNTGTFDISISDLTPSTAYHFRAIAYGDDTGFGSDKTFTTNRETSAPTVTTDDASNITTTGATLNGNLTNRGGADNVTVSFEWGLTTSYGSETTTQLMTTTGTFNAALSNLSPSTTYHFRAIADGDGTSYGEDETFTTETNPLSVTTSAASNITTNSATLNGNLTGMGMTNNITVSFEWGTTQGGPYPNKTTAQTMTTTGVFSDSLTGLDSSTTYYFKTKAIGNNISSGSELSFQTKAEATPPGGGSEDSILGDLDWKVLAIIGGGVLFVIVLLFTMTRAKARTVGGTRQGGIRQQPLGTQQTSTCPKCGATITFGSSPCPNCGTPLNWGSQQTSTCPRCGATITFGSSPCPNCGTPLNWGSQQTSTCPRCGATITFGSSPCPNCGTPLNWHT